MALVNRCETIARDRSLFVEGTTSLRGKTSIISLLDATQVSGCLADEYLFACLFFVQLSSSLPTLLSVRRITSRSRTIGGTLLNVVLKFLTFLDAWKLMLINVRLMKRPKTARQDVSFEHFFVFNDAFLCGIWLFQIVKTSCKNIEIKKYLARYTRNARRI